MECVLFSRVSSKSQEETGYSLPVQRKLLQDYAERKDFRIVERFSISESASGKKQRKIFNEMMSYVKKNNVKIICVEKVDRLTRNFQDSLLIDEWLKKDTERQVHFVKQNLVIHQNSKSHEKFQWDIYVVLARHHSNNLSEETKKGLLGKALSGWYPGSRKRGYILMKIEDSKKSIWALDKGEKSEIPFIKKAFELYANTDWSLKKLRQEMLKEGWRFKNGNPIPKSNLAFILNDIFYCGKFKWKEEIYKGKHKPIISEELFQIVQQKLKRKYNSKYRQHNHLFKGMLKCGECGYSITAEIQKGHTYYHCTHFKPCNQRKYIRQKEIEKQILDSFDEITIKDKKLLELISETLRESHAEEITYHNQILTTLNKRYQALQNRLDAIYIDKLDKNIMPEKYSQLEADFRKQQKETREEINKHEKANINYFELGSNLLELSVKAKQIYLNREKVEDKRRLLHLIFSNLILKDGKVDKTYTKPFQIISERVKNEDVLPGLDSNQDGMLQRHQSYR